MKGISFVIPIYKINRQLLFILVKFVRIIIMRHYFAIMRLACIVKIMIIYLIIVNLLRIKLNWSVNFVMLKGTQLMLAKSIDQRAIIANIDKLWDIMLFNALLLQNMRFAGNVKVVDMIQILALNFHEQNILVIFVIVQIIQLKIALVCFARDVISLDIL